ncbi:3-deoxy-manno-octulosonate cytidylyltransferase, mitochondrial [Linum perenne]
MRGITSRQRKRGGARRLLKGLLPLKPTSLLQMTIICTLRITYLDAQKVKGKNPYPHKFSITMTIVEALAMESIRLQATPDAVFSTAVTALKPEDPFDPNRVKCVVDNKAMQEVCFSK